MTTPANPVVATPSLEDKILQAVAESEQIVAGFSPVAAQLIASGVAVEPVFSGLIHMIAGLFKHHTSQAKTASPVTQ